MIECRNMGICTCVLSMHLLVCLMYICTLYVYIYVCIHKCTLTFSLLFVLTSVRHKNNNNCQRRRKSLKTCLPPVSMLYPSVPRHHHLCVRLSPYLPVLLDLLLAPLLHPSSLVYPSGVSLGFLEFLVSGRKAQAKYKVRIERKKEN